MSAVPLAVAPGVRLAKGWFGTLEQRELLAEIRRALDQAPLYRALMPRSGAPLSVRMSNCGNLGWTSDVERGYRYEPIHPVTGRPWPPIPAGALSAWRALSQWQAEPEACLINYYDAAARMGLHQDRDERDLAAPVLSISLGDEAVFRLGGTQRKAPTLSLRLCSGDVLVFGGPARLAFHGVDRVIAGSSTLLAEGGRFNLTLRRVSPPPLRAGEISSA